jgi:tetratricopeptide (TPR) repeat protein
MKWIAIFFIFCSTLAFSNVSEQREIKAYKEALQKDPDNIEYLNRLAHLYIMTHQFEKAEAVLVKAVKIDPSNAESRLQLGRVYLWEGKDQLADEMAHEILLMDSNHADAYALKGMVAESLGDDLAARRYYEAALHIDPQNMEAIHGLEEVAFKEEVLLQPKALDKAENLYKEGKLNESLRIYRRLIEINPSNPQYYYEFALLNMHLEQWMAAEESIKYAMHLEPENDQFELTLFEV